MIRNRIPACLMVALACGCTERSPSASSSIESSDRTSVEASASSSIESSARTSAEPSLDASGEPSAKGTSSEPSAKRTSSEPSASEAPRSLEEGMRELEAGLLKVLTVTAGSQGAKKRSAQAKNTTTDKPKGKFKDQLEDEPKERRP